MNSTLTASFIHLKTSFTSPSLLHSTTLKFHNSISTPSLKIPKAAASSSNHTSKSPLTQKLKTLTKTAILIGVAASIAGKFPVLSAKAETPAALTFKSFIQFLQKNVEEALKSYQELSKEDPKDFRPYFCRGMIYSLLDRNEEAKEQFAKYRELSPKKFELEGYLKTSLSRMKLFGSNEKN
uniref:Uncharacterized protein n=1 Tax=Populus alba TaxID=43335 RepID=A0A4U5NL64_POPAL|nr:uncharacterized protein D5086_0000263650 [Populus alba]